MPTMMKSTAGVFALALAIAGASTVGFSQSAAPTTPDACLKSAFELAQSAESKKLPDPQLDKIEALLTKMESHCDAKQFAEAMVVAKDIKSAIETK